MHINHKKIRGKKKHIWIVERKGKRGAIDRMLSKKLYQPNPGKKTQLAIELSLLSQLSEGAKSSDILRMKTCP